MLETNSNDADANLALGRFYALARGDWDRGLPLLAKGNDAPLKSLATADLATPADGNAAAELADRYAARATSETGPAKTNLQCRKLLLV